MRAKWHCDPKRYGTVDFSAVQIKGQSASAFYTHKQSLSLQVIVEPLNLDAQEGDHEFLESLRHSGQQQSSKESSEKDIHPISGKHRIRLVSHLNALIGDKYFIEFKIAVRMDDEYCLITCLDNEYFVTDGAMRCVVDQKTGGGSSVVIYPTRAVRLSAVVSAVPYGTQLVENAFDEKLFSPIVSINVK